MKITAPSYYSDFACTAGSCAHSCCIGWEIDIDDDTYEYYRSIGGTFGKRLSDGIALHDGTHCFILGSHERCPFLNGSNLCDIIINLGEDALCQICADHPRYRNFYDGRVEIGLGMCCEAAAKLILTYKDKVEFVVIDDDGEDEAECEQERIFTSLRRDIFDIIQNRTEPLKKRINKICRTYGISLPQKTPAEWAAVYAGFERLDTQWQDMLENLSLLGTVDIKPPAEDAWSIAFEQLIIYFLCRHMTDGIYDGTLAARITFALHAPHIIHLLCIARFAEHGSVTIDDMTEFSRMYCAEMEYSEDNMTKILDILDKEYDNAGI